MKSQVLMSDGSVAQGVVAINRSGQSVFGDVYQAIPDTNSAAELAALYGNFQGVTAGDFVTRKATSNGQVITALAIGLLIDDAESNITVDVPVTQPAALEIEASMSQRVRHQFASICLFENDDAGPFPVPADIEIAIVYQSSADAGVAYNAVAGTILTIVLKTALPAGVYLSDWVHTFGLVDNRLNYPNLAIKFISYDRKTITCGFSDDAVLPSLAVAAITPPNGSAFIKFYKNLAGAANGFGMRFTGTAATQAALVSIFGGGANDDQISGTILGDHRVTVGSSDPIYANGVNGNVEIRATSRYRLEGRPRDCSWYDTAATMVTAGGYTARATRTSVKPAVQVALRPRFRAYRPKSMTRPVGKIVSIAKTGTTTATVNTASAHNLTTNNWVTIKGVRDQTNFANISTPAQVTVVNATQFTIVLGAAVTATSYGGAVILTNGGVDQQGAIAQVVQSASIAAATGVLTLVGSGNWAGLNIGDYAELYGLRDNATGADLGIDGAWEVANISTTSLDLMPIVDIFGVRVSPDLASLASTDCGGQVIQRTTLRAHDILLEDWSENRMMIDGAGTQRLDRALPVRIVAIDGSPAVTANEGNPIAPSSTAYALVSAATTNAASVKATAGTLFELSLFNATAATVYLKLYNKASAPTVGTDVPIMTIPVAAGALFNAEFGRLGKRFNLGIALAITGAAVATDTTVVAAGAQLSATYV